MSSYSTRRTFFAFIATLAFGFAPATAQDARQGYVPPARDMVRAVAKDATDFVICTTMSKFDRALVATAHNAIKAGLLEHDRLSEDIVPWVLFGRVKVQRAVKQFNGTRENSAEFEGYINRYLKQGLAVFGNWLPDRKAFEEVFKFHPADKALDMSPVAKLVDEMKEEKVIRA